LRAIVRFFGMTRSDLQLHVSDAIGSVSGVLVQPPDARLLYVLAHGAGAGMRHPFLESITENLAERGIATLRFQFPYMEAGRKRPDYPSVLEATVRAAVSKARELAPELIIIAGGKSLGGRMTSGAAANGSLPGVKGLAFLGFPLHPPGEPGIQRAAHLDRVRLPMLFLQGTRDAFARLDLLSGVCGRLPAATLHMIEGGDHSFGVLKRDGRSQAEVLKELGDSLAQWAREQVLGAVPA
jgi:predicted alpha/beta-hydrolase family hydrolase